MSGHKVQGTVNGGLRLVVFDVDGTLVDSQHNIVAAMGMACATVGVSVPSDAQVRAIIGLSLDAAVAAVTPEATPDERTRVSALYKDAFACLRARPDHHEPLFPGAREALDAVEAAGCLLGLATGKSRRGVMATIERHGLEGRFTAIRTADDGPGKPHPAMLWAAMEDVGADPSETVMIGDTTFDMEMARAARTDALGVRWGYHPDAALKASGARLVLPTFAALPAALPWACSGAADGQAIAPVG